MASKTFAVAEKDRYLLKFLRVSLSLDSYYYSSPVYNRVHAMVGMLAAFLSTYKLISTYNSLLLPSVLGFMLCSCSVVSLQLILFYRSALTHSPRRGKCSAPCMGAYTESVGKPASSV